jgi:VCBS repeat-containing protein
MDKASYEKSQYCMSAIQHPDKVTVSKTQGSDWCHVTLDIHGKEDSAINIRSKEMAEQLHFMLGQMLGK